MKKTVLITGAGRGIGWETSLFLAVELKYTVIALSRNSTQLELLKEKAAASGGTIIILSHDFMDDDFSPVLNILEKNKITSIDILMIKKPFVEMTRDDLYNSYRVNVISPYLLIQQLLPFLKKSARAHIVNISSMGGFQGTAKFPGLTAYSSSKASLTCLTECLAEELKPDNISINCLCLGAVATEMLAAAFPGYQAPLNASEMARFVSRFANEYHQVMNGKVIPVSLSTP